MSLRPVLRKSHSSADSSRTPNTLSPSSSSKDLLSIHQPSTASHPGMQSSNSSSHISIQLPTHGAERATEPRLPSALAVGGSGSGSGPGSGPGSVGMPRTRTNSTGQGTGDGRYRRKVGFEAFEAGPAAMFAYTCQVSPRTMACSSAGSWTNCTGQERRVQAFEKHPSVRGRGLSRRVG